MWISSRSKPAATARSVQATKSAFTASMSARVISRGTWLTPASHGIGEGAINGQLPSGSGSFSPSHSSLVEPLRPACPNWAPIAEREWMCTKSTIRFQAGTCSSR